MLTIIGKIASIFIIVGIGYLLNKTRIIPASVNPYLIQILLLVTTPCMILQALSSRKLTDETFNATIEVLVGSVIYFIVAIILSFLLAKHFKGLNADDYSTYAVLMTSINTGFMGFPITKAIFGNEYFYFMVIQNVILTLYLYTVMPWQFNMGSSKKSDKKELIKSVFNLCTIATIIGLIMLFSGLQFPQIVDDGLKTIGDATIPLSMIVVGIELGKSKLSDILGNRNLLLSSLISMIGFPLLTFLAVNWLPLYTQTKVILIFAAAFPAAVVSVAISKKEGKNSKLMAEGVALTTFESLITLTLWSIFIMHFYF